MTRANITRRAHETGAAPWIVWTDLGPVLRDEHGDEPLRLGSLAELMKKAKPRTPRGLGVMRLLTSLHVYESG